MAGRYKPYPEYKNSEIEWLSDMPAHWGIAPIKYMALESESLFLDGDWIESKDISTGGIRYITTGNVTNGKFREQGTGYITEDTFRELNCTEVHEGDILIARLNDPIGRACIIPDLKSKIVTSVDNVIFRPDKKYHKKYLVHLFSSESYFRHTGNLARGATMQRISRGLLGNIRIVVPPFEEQEQISNFLDHETTKIDTLIEKQQQLITLLKEKRQSVISLAVTKGLNPKTKMHSSGINWLGEVPEHWKIKTIKQLFKQTKRQGYSDLEVLSVYRDYGVIEKSSREDNNNKTPDNLSTYQLVEVNDLVINKMKAWQGSLGVSNHVGITSPDYIVYKATHSENSKFIHYSLRASHMPDVYHSISNGIRPSQWRLEPEKFEQLFVLLPPQKEQQGIIEYLDIQLKKIDKLIERCTSASQTMQERRTALISAAVTGKIDIRDWIAPQVSQTNREVAA